MKTWFEENEGYSGASLFLTLAESDQRLWSFSLLSYLITGPLCGQQAGLELNTAHPLKQLFN